MKKYLRSIATILTKQEKRRFITLVTLNLFISIADIASLALLVYIVHFYTQPVASAYPAFLPDWLFNRASATLVLLFLVVYSAKNIAAYYIHRAQCRFMAQVATRLSQKKLLNYLEGNYIDYITIDSSVHIRKISYQPLEFCQHILDGMQQMITQIALVALTITAILLFNAQLFLLLFVLLLPPVIGVFYLLKRRLRTVRAHSQHTREKALQHLQEALAGYIESAIYNKTGFFRERYTHWQQQFNTHLARYLAVQGMPGRIIELFALLGLFLLIALGQHTTGDTTIVTLGAFMAAAYKIIPGIVKILTLSGQMSAYDFTIRDPAKPVNSISETKSSSQKISIQSIRFENVSFQYNGQPVLQNLNFCIQPGDFMGISGASGKGKTTLLHLLTGFLSPDNGKIYVNEKVKTSDSRKQYRPAIAYVKQQPFLIHDTLLTNITLGHQPYNKQLLQQAVIKAGLDELIQSFPEKLDKVISENGRNISGGQRQRIALARALYKNADLLILDEPFNELDERSEKKIIRHLKELTQQGKMIILVTHHTAGFSLCNKLLSLDAW